MSEVSTSNKKVAVVLFNLGGPDSLESVRSFLYNLFNDKYIIRLPQPFRSMIAFFISTLRNKKAQAIYAHTGNKSPILEETIAQQKALELALKTNGGDWKVFIAMRHWHPFADEAIIEVNKYHPDEVILLPLYPQFSTTTTASSVEDFKNKWQASGNDINILKTICCYPLNQGFINAHTGLIKTKLDKLENYRILFSAHGLPKSIIEQGDPYQWQVENTVKLIVQQLSIDNLDYKVTYQSKVGPMEWLGPNTEEEIEKAAEEKKALVIVPIAFVSEHVETVVELDIEYGNIAKEKNITYVRVPTLSINEVFIRSLADNVRRFTDLKPGITASDSGKRLCPGSFKNCQCI